MVSWRVLTNKDVNQSEVIRLLSDKGGNTLKSIVVTRKELQNGFLVHKDEELCFIATGPANFDELLLNHPLINDVEKSPVYKHAGVA